MHFIQVTAPFCRLLRSIRFARALRSIRIVRLFRYIGALRTLALSILSTMVGNWDFFVWTSTEILVKFHQMNIYKENQRERKNIWSDNLPRPSAGSVSVALIYYLHACLQNPIGCSCFFGFTAFFCRGQWGTMTYAQFDVALSNVYIHCHSVCALSMVVYIAWWYDDACVSWYCMSQIDIVSCKLVCKISFTSDSDASNLKIWQTACLLDCQHSFAVVGSWYGPFRCILGIASALLGLPVLDLSAFDHPLLQLWRCYLVGQGTVPC